MNNNARSKAFARNDQRHLVVYLDAHSWISDKAMQRLFSNKLFSPKIKVSIQRGDHFKYL